MKKTETVQEMITNDFDKMIAKAKEEIASASDEVKSEYEELLAELEADKQEMLEGTVVGSEQWQKDELFMHQFSIGAGIVMAGVGGFLLFKARKAIDKSKAKIAGWLLAGLGVGIVALHLAQMFL